MAKIGFIGIGHMGAPMANNLIAAGHAVTVFDLSEDAVAKAVAAGAHAADSLETLAKNKDIIFTMVQSGEQVKALCLGESGLFALASPGTLFIDSSSIDVESSRLCHEQAKAQGFDMLDAPVSGGVIGAEAGSLTIMVGGEAAVFEKAQPIFAVLGKNIVHAGPAGNGQVAKICNNMILGASMIAVSEAFNLGEKLGLDPATFFQISSKASGQCWSMTSYAPVPGLVDNAPSNHDFEPGFTAQMMLKDLRLSQLASASADVATPMGAKATALYEAFSEDGFGQIDFSGIIQWLAKK